MGAPPAVVETLDSPFQSEKGLFEEIDGEWRRLGEQAERELRVSRVCSMIANGNPNRVMCIMSP
jgi:hypothetical protein